MTRATSQRKRDLEDILGLPPKSLKSPPGFAKGGAAPRGRTPIPSAEEFAKMSFADILAKLSEKKAKFVTEILKGTDHEQAVLNAGWNARTKNSRKSRAAHMLRRDPWVMAAIRAARTEVATEVKYDLTASFKDFQEAAEFAKQTENATALVRAREMQSKLFGHLVDRQDVRNLSALSINITGID